MSVRVLYIMGYGRSGSTLLDILMGSQPNGFAAGELSNLIDAMDIRREYCACGQLSSECDFWRRVRAEWTERRGGMDSASYEGLRNRFERLRYMRRLLSDKSATQRSDFDTYQRRTIALFESVQVVSQCEYIVDSSKSPARALALSLMEGLDVYVIHLVRDCRGIVCSLKRSWTADPRGGIVKPIDSRPALRTVASWLLVNSAANHVRARLGERSLLLRYETLSRDPVAALGKIGDMSGVNFCSVQERLQSGALKPDHLIAGNRLRMQDTVRIKPADESWRKELSRSQQALLGCLASPLAQAYDYRALSNDIDS